MAWNPNTPENPFTAMSLDQAQLQENFAEFLRIFEEDHISLTAVTVADRGKHLWTRMPSIQLTNTTIADTDASEVTLYTDTFPEGPNTSELFYKGPSNADPIGFTQRYGVSGRSIRLASGIILIFGRTVTLNNGQVRVPGAPGAVTQNISGIPNIPTLTTILAVFAFPGGELGPTADPNTSIYVADFSDPSAVVFNFWVRDTNDTGGSDNNPFTFSYLVIGV